MDRGTGRAPAGAHTSGLKAFLRRYLEDERDPRKRAFDVVMIVVVLVSIASYILSVSGDLGPRADAVVHDLDYMFVAIFAVEYLARLFVATDFLADARRAGIGAAIGAKMRVVFRPMMLIDLVALLPAVRALRVVRLFRLLRILRLVSYQSSFASVVDVFREHAFELVTVFVFMLVVLVIAGIGVFLVENPVANPESQIKDLGDGFWWAIVTMTTVGYGDKVPLTSAGRILAGIVAVSGILVIAFPTAIIVSAFNDKLLRLKEGKLDMTAMKDHVVICGLTRATEIVVKDLQEFARYHHRPVEVVVISSYSDGPAPHGALFKKGDVTREAVMHDAGVQGASSVVILAERRVPEQPDETVDARSILAAMHAATLNPEAYVVVEVLIPENVATLRKHVPRAECIESSAIVPRLMTVATMHRGVNAVFSEILAPGGNDVYEVDVTEKALAAAPTFGAAMRELRKPPHPAVAISVRRGREVKTNPADDFALAAGDTLLVLAEQRPTLG